MSSLYTLLCVHPLSSSLIIVSWTDGGYDSCRLIRETSSAPSLRKTTTQSYVYENRMLSSMKTECNNISVPFSLFDVGIPWNFCGISSKDENGITITKLRKFILHICDLMCVNLLPALYIPLKFSYDKRFIVICTFQYILW